ncbi:MAG: CPBP family intramembrane glutamic endopeptidase [Thermodesulfobacteriota bacterium]|nr:CPBP family intramembrane glutamic endopeptidase [Thermodesulfobacteriota bacterium]
MNKDIFIALLTFALLLILAFTFSIGLELGEAESLHAPSSLLLYCRRILMVIAALAIPWFTLRQTPAALGWDFSIKWLGISLAVGLFMGFSNPGGFNPKDPIAILLALFHTFATELFFRGYLFKTFERTLKGVWIPILLSSFCYGLSYLTTWPIWNSAPIAKLAFVMLFTCVGIPFAYGYKKSGSFFVPWLMHFFGVLKYGMLF